MIIGGDKKPVIQNIQKNIQAKQFNAKVELNDPKLDLPTEDQILEHFLQQRSQGTYHVKNIIARLAMSFITQWCNRSTEVHGLHNLADLNTGAIITSNHFNPLDNTAIRYALRSQHRRLYIVSQATNLQMQGSLGFFMNYDDILPLGRGLNYLGKIFPQLLQTTLQQNNYILIYPEQEMWFNYRKPRPLKRGPYYYAARFNVPVISCFVEMQDLKKPDNKQFNQIRYLVHILPIIYPQARLSDRDNSYYLMQQDYQQKKAAYEAAYQQKLTYNFETADIVGWRLS